MLRFVFTFAGAAAVCCALFADAAGAADRQSGCTMTPYAYAGLVANANGYGVRATVTATRPPNVANGHVAGWIGVGDTFAGPQGQPEWLQVGLNAFADGRAELYAEIMLPGSAPVYRTLGAVTVGRPYRLAVVESPGAPGIWQVWVNGRAALRQIALPGSHRGFQPMAMTESWNGGIPVCNDYSYRFANVFVARLPRTWQRLTRASAAMLTDIGFGIQPTPSGFVAGRVS